MIKTGLSVGGRVSWLVIHMRESYIRSLQLILMHYYFGLYHLKLLYVKLLTLIVQQKIYFTMHNKLSNCFVWVSPSTTDFEFHLLSWRYRRRSSDKNFHLKNTELPKAAAVLKWRWILRLAGDVGFSDRWGMQKHFQAIVWSPKTEKKRSKCYKFFSFTENLHNLTF